MKTATKQQQNSNNDNENSNNDNDNNNDNNNDDNDDDNNTTTIPRPPSCKARGAPTPRRGPKVVCVPRPQGRRLPRLASRGSQTPPSDPLQPRASGGAQISS